MWNIKLQSPWNDFVKNEGINYFLKTVKHCWGRKVNANFKVAFLLSTKEHCPYQGGVAKPASPVLQRSAWNSRYSLPTTSRNSGQKKQETVRLVETCLPAYSEASHCDSIGSASCMLKMTRRYLEMYTYTKCLSPPSPQEGLRNLSTASLQGKPTVQLP